MNIKKSDILDTDLLNIILRIYIEIFDIESGEEYEKTVKLILFNLIDVDIELFWRTLISKAVEYGANRRCLSRENLKEQCKSYFKENQTKEELLASPFFNRSWKENNKYNLQVLSSAAPLLNLHSQSNVSNAEAQCKYFL